MMKRKQFLLFLMLCFVILGGCELTEDGSYVAPITTYEKVAGSWNLTNLTQVDEIAKAASTEPNEVQLTAAFGFSDFQMTLSVDASGQPTTYEVTGGAPNLFTEAGYWKLDNDFVHADGSSSQILLYSDAAKTSLVDKLTVTAIPGAVANLELKLTRSTNELAYVSYIYKLSPQN